MIEHQILVTDLQGNVLQLEERINNHILGVKGSTRFSFFDKLTRDVDIKVIVAGY